MFWNTRNEYVKRHLRYKQCFMNEMQNVANIDRIFGLVNSGQLLLILRKIITSNEYAMAAADVPLAGWP